MSEILITGMDLSEDRQIIITKEGEVLATDWRGVAMPTEATARELPPVVKASQGNPWRTGEPTEAGWYLIKYKVGKNGERTCYRTEEYELTPHCTFKNMEWQKIEGE